MSHQSRQSTLFPFKRRVEAMKLEGESGKQLIILMKKIKEKDSLQVDTHSRIRRRLVLTKLEALHLVLLHKNGNMDLAHCLINLLLLLLHFLLPFLLLNQQFCFLPLFICNPQPSQRCSRPQPTPSTCPPPWALPHTAMSSSFSQIEAVNFPMHQLESLQLCLLWVYSHTRHTLLLLHKLYQDKSKLFQPWIPSIQSLNPLQSRPIQSFKFCLEVARSRLSRQSLQLLLSRRRLQKATNKDRNRDRDRAVWLFLCRQSMGRKRCKWTKRRKDRKELCLWERRQIELLQLEMRLRLKEITNWMPVCSRFWKRQGEEIRRQSVIVLQDKSEWECSAEVCLSNKTLQTLADFQSEREKNEREGYATRIWTRILVWGLKEGAIWLKLCLFLYPTDDNR